MSLRRLGVAKKGEEGANYLELDSGLFDQLGPPSHNSHIYPTPPKATGVENIEERLEPPSPPFAQGRISTRIRAMFSGDHPIPRAPVVPRRAPHRGPIATTSDGVIPYLEPHAPAGKENSRERRLPPIAPTNPNYGRRYPWEPKRRPPPSLLPDIQRVVQPPIRFPKFELSPGEQEDHVSNGLDLYEPVSSHFDDFDTSYSHPKAGAGTSGLQDGSSTNLSHKRSGLIHTIAARKPYPQVVKLSHSRSSNGEIVDQGVLPGHMPSPEINPPVFQVGPPVHRVPGSLLSGGEEPETGDPPGTSHPEISQKEVDGGLSHESNLKVLTQPCQHKRHKIDSDTRRERGSYPLPPAIHLPADQRSTRNVRVVSPLFGPDAVTTAALLLGTGKDVNTGGPTEVVLNRPVTHYRDLNTVGDKTFTWKEGARPGASRPRKDAQEAIKGKTTNHPGELEHIVEESGSHSTSSRNSSIDDKLSATHPQAQLTSRSASMETVKDPHTDSPGAVISEPRRQIALISEHWVPSNRSPTATTFTTPSPRRRILNSLASLTLTKSAPQSSQGLQIGGASTYSSNLEPPEIPKDAGTRSFRIKGAGPWLASHLPQKKPANPFPGETPMPEVKKTPVPDPDENFEKFLQARAKEEEASHRPGRKRKHLGGLWEKRKDC